MERDTKPDAIHTMAEDLSAAAPSGEGMNMREIIEAEDKKETERKETEQEPKRNLYLLLASAACVLAGIGAVIYFAVHDTPASVPIEKPTAAGSLIFAEKIHSIELAEKDASAFKEEIAKEVVHADISPRAIQDVRFTFEQDGATYRADSKRFLLALDSRASAKLVTALSSLYMFGIYRETGNKPFLILTTANYADAFAGMREWEARLFDDLYRPFNIPIGGDNANLFAAQFEDATIANVDVRALRTASGSIALFYGFVGNDTIVVATNEAAFSEVLARLSAQKVQQ